MDLKNIRRRDGSPFPLYLNDALAEAFRNVISDVHVDLAGDFEDPPRDLIVVEGGNSKFGGGTDGGFGAEVRVTLSYLIDTGLGHKEANARVEAANDTAYETALTAWWERHGEAAIAEGLQREGLSYCDIEEADLEVNDFTDLEQEAMEGEDIVLRIGLFYYGVENSNHGCSWGRHNAYYFIAAEMDGPYLGGGTITMLERTVKFDPDDAESLAKLLATVTYDLGGADGYDREED